MSIVKRALGPDFEKLHPVLQTRYGFSSSDQKYSVGIGTMERIWMGSKLFWPFLLVGSIRNIMSPEAGTNVPFRIECWAYRDTFNRETLSLNRVFKFRKQRKFDEYLVQIPDTSHLIVYVGSHQHLAVEVDLSVCEKGGLKMATGRQRLFTRLGSVRFPLWLSAEARVHEVYDEASKQLRIDARVRNRMLGDVFCAIGSFSTSLESIPSAGPPPHIRATVEQSRW